MNIIGLVEQDNAGGHFVWANTIVTGQRIELYAYEGQLFAETDAPVWSVAWYDQAHCEPIRSAEGLTLATALRAARPE